MGFDVAFLCRLVPEQLAEHVREMSRDGMTAAADALQWSLVRGLDQANGRPSRIFNVLPVGSFPKRYHEWRVRRTHFRHAEQADDVNLAYINLAGVKQVLRPFVATRDLVRWARSTDGAEKAVLAYTPDRAFLRAVRWVKRRHPGITLVLILPDVPRYLNLSGDSSWAMRVFKRWLARRVEGQLNIFDGFVVLAHPMIGLLGLDGPHLVLEGVATEAVYTETATVPDGIRRIFHAGTLNLSFGIRELLEAFSMIDDPAYRLEFCGIGDAVGEIQAACRRDPRIQYSGQLQRSEVLGRAGAATVIVNPRRPVSAFTAYSFPSKNLEALSLGRPLVAFKLGGIPPEYDEHIWYVPEDTVEALSATLVRVCELPEGTRTAAAERAQAFVLSEKGELAQGLRVVALLDRLSAFSDRASGAAR